MDEIKINLKDEFKNFSKTNACKLLYTALEELIQCEINIDGVKIIPLWIEGYFSFRNKEDGACHDRHNKETNQFYQRNKPFQLYFHTKGDNKKGPAGVDLVISFSDDYACSILLKALEINGKTYRQRKCAQVLKEKLNADANEYNYKPTAIQFSKINTDFEFCKRIGVEWDKIHDVDLACHQKNIKYNKIKNNYVLLKI